MHREINLDSIHALEERIREHPGPVGAIIQLKRNRNSLLNVSVLLPPEILGRIFRWNATPYGDFGGLPKGSYNFLLVCHHWFEVASRTPELWNFWGNSIRDWTHRHARCGTAPLDLVLSNPEGELGDQLRDALWNRATRDTIRSVHLRDNSTSRKPVLSSVISSIVVEGEETRSSSVESFVVDNRRRPIVDVSAFFSRYHLPKLRRLHLHGCRISPSSILPMSRITTLTTLKIARGLTPTPTSPQLLSIISSNPLLQFLDLSPSSAPRVTGDHRPSPSVPLRHLKELYLWGETFHATSWLLNRLELPDQLDSLEMTLFGFSLEDISQSLGPYLGDRVRRLGGLPGGGLELSAKHSGGFFNLCVESTRTTGDSAEVYLSVHVMAIDPMMKDEEAVRLGFDLIAHIPREQIVHLKTTLPILRSEELCIGMRNLTYLRVSHPDLSTWFIEPDIWGPDTSRELLRSLDRLDISRPTLGGGDWIPLTNFLTRRAAVGNRISLLLLKHYPLMRPEVVESIEQVVEVFEGCA